MVLTTARDCKMLPLFCHFSILKAWIQVKQEQQIPMTISLTTFIFFFFHSPFSIHFLHLKKGPQIFITWCWSPLLLQFFFAMHNGILTTNPTLTLTQPLTPDPIPNHKPTPIPNPTLNPNKKPHWKPFARMNHLPKNMLCPYLLCSFSR